MITTVSLVPPFAAVLSHQCGRPGLISQSLSLSSTSSHPHPELNSDQIVVVECWFLVIFFVLLFIIFAVPSSDQICQEKYPLRGWKSMKFQIQSQPDKMSLLAYLAWIEHSSGGALPAPYLICGPIFAPRPPYSGAAVPHWQPTEQVSLHKTKCMTRSKEKYTIKIKMARGPTPNSLPNITNKCRVLHYLAGWRKCVLFLLDLDEFLFWCLMSFVKYKIGKFQYYWGWTCSQFKFLWWSQCIHFQNPQSPKKISTTTELSFSDIFLIVAYPSWFGHTYVGYESTVSRPYLMDLSAPPRVADTNLHLYNRISLAT